MPRHQIYIFTAFISLCFVTSLYNITEAKAFEVDNAENRLNYKIEREESPSRHGENTKVSGWSNFGDVSKIGSDGRKRNKLLRDLNRPGRSPEWQRAEISIKYLREMNPRVKRGAKNSFNFLGTMNDERNDHFYEGSYNIFDRSFAGGEEVVTPSIDNNTESSGFLNGIRNLFRHSSRVAETTTKTTTHLPANFSALLDELNRARSREINKIAFTPDNSMVPLQRSVPVSPIQLQTMPSTVKNETIGHNKVGHIIFDLELKAIPIFDGNRTNDHGDQTNHPSQR